MSLSCPICSPTFKRANEALRREEFDYVEELMSGAVRHCPKTVTFRQFLRGAQYKKYDDNGSGGRMAGMRTKSIKAKIVKARMSKDWPTVDTLAEEGLRINPWDETLLAYVGEAAHERGFAEVAIDSYGRALKQDPKNVDLMRTLANIYMEEEKWDDAAKMWEGVMQILPTDGEARTNIGRCHTNKAIRRGFEQEEESPAANAYDEDHKARSQKTKSVGPGDDEEADLKRAIRKDEENPSLYVNYAVFLKRNGRLKESEEQYKLAHEKSGGDDDIREQWEDVQLSFLRQKYEDLQEAEDRAEGTEKEAARAKRIEFKKAFYKRRLQVLTAREKRYPNDMRVKFEIAEIYMEVKQYGEAIPRLQQAQNDTRLRGPANLRLGLCFMKSQEDRNLGLALRSLQKASEMLDPQDQKVDFLETHYAIGYIHESKGEADKAEEHYNEVLAHDYTFRDVKDRLRAMAN